jgi:hypothetical protein
MIPSLFLACALALPAPSFTHPTVVSYHAAKSESEQLEDFIKRKDPYAAVLITPKADPEKMRKDGFERVPFTHRGREIWIQRKPATDKKKLLESA